ncbi:hypothetical protein AAP_01470 [Ascosphaera apis ARSEF 7405]|uniref:Uncharacterized protein n=1 Tax=Ascosphaera apis ARSEF 7405 TaxID=392613 RepID=A0A168BVC3_9EURO|nr:hypothetical protein AAP_01470 [Ascosphaera apis ARSEF 7405]
MLSRITPCTSKAQSLSIYRPVRYIPSVPTAVQLVHGRSQLSRYESTTVPTSESPDEKVDHPSQELPQEAIKRPALTAAPRIKPQDLDLPLRQIKLRATDTTGANIRQHPWMRQLRSAKHYKDNAFGRLQQELLVYYHFMKQTSKEKQARFVTGEYLKDIFASAPGLEHHVKLNPFIDVAVPHSPLVFFSKIRATHGVAQEANQRRAFVRNLRLQAIENALFAMNSGSNLGKEVFVRDESVDEGSDSQCLTLRHVPTGLQIIVHADRWTQQPARADAVRRYLLRYHQLEPIYVALRMLLEINGLFSDGYSRNPEDKSGTERRTLDPYTLMLLIVGALRHSKNAANYFGSDYSSPFLDVLNVVATWDMTKYGISVASPYMFRFGSPQDPFRSGQPKQMALNINAVPQDGKRHMCIQDVVEDWKNACRHITTAGEIQDLFRVTFLDVSSQMEQWERSTEVFGEDGKIVDRPIILRAWGANYTSLNAWRKKMVKGADTLESYFRSRRHLVPGKEKEPSRPTRRRHWWYDLKHREKELERDEFEDETQMAEN